MEKGFSHFYLPKHGIIVPKNTTEILGFKHDNKQNGARNPVIQISVNKPTFVSSMLLSNIMKFIYIPDHMLFGVCLSSNPDVSLFGGSHS